MSKYTTELRFICEQQAGLVLSKPCSDVDEIIQAAIPKIFSFNFPVFDENYRNVLCTKILRHYYTREISEEVYGLWKLRLETKLNEIMPYYNQLYKSELLDFNPLYDTDLSTTNSANKNGSIDVTGSKTENETGRVNSTDNGKTTGTENGKTTDNESTENDVTKAGTSKETTTDTAKTISSDTGKVTTAGTDTKTSSESDLYSDTPQGSLSNVENETYLTNARKKSWQENNSHNETVDNSASVTTDFTDSITKTGETNDTENNTGTKEATGTIENTTSGTSENTHVGTTARELNGESTSGTVSKSTEDYTLHVLGKSAGGSYSNMLKEFRGTFLNIDMQVIDELSPLFFNLW